MIFSIFQKVFYLQNMELNGFLSPRRCEKVKYLCVTMGNVDCVGKQNSEKYRPCDFTMWRHQKVSLKWDHGGFLHLLCYQSTFCSHVNHGQNHLSLITKKFKSTSHQFWGDPIIDMCNVHDAKGKKTQANLFPVPSRPQGTFY